MYPSGYAMVSVSWTSFESPIAGVRMASTTASVGEQLVSRACRDNLKAQIYESMGQVSDWLERSNYHGYDSFDRLNGKLLRPLTFAKKFLRTLPPPGIPRFPLHLRPLFTVATS